jgi:hypothetical protein
MTIGTERGLTSLYSRTPNLSSATAEVDRVFLCLEYAQLLAGGTIDIT